MLCQNLVFGENPCGGVWSRLGLVVPVLWGWSYGTGPATWGVALELLEGYLISGVTYIYEFDQLKY
jgi:hypothetical protein